MVDDEDLYEHLTMMANLADELEEVTTTNVMDEDFMMTVCFSIMEIPQYTNIIKIVINDPILERGDLINKLTTSEQRHKVTNKRPPELHTTMQALDTRKRKRKKGVCFNCGKEEHFAKEYQSKPRRTLEEHANKVTSWRTKFVFTTQLGGSQSDRSNTWILESGASRHMVLLKS